MPGWSTGGSQTELSGVVVQGESAKADSNTPVVRGRAITVEDAAGVFKPGNKTKCAILFGAILCSCFGLVPAAIQYAVLTNNGGMDTPCDAPIPWWLALSAIITLATLVAQVLVSSCTVFFGEKGEDGKVKKPAISQCLECLIIFPLSIFAFYWYIKGNLWVWGTHAYNATVTNITELALNSSIVNIMDGSLDKGVGCQPGILQGSRVFLIVTYAAPGAILVLTCCIMCCIMGCMAARGSGSA